MHSLHCKRNPQQAKNRFVAESATLLLFFDLLCCFGFHKQVPKSLYRSKSLEYGRICGVRSVQKHHDELEWENTMMSRKHLYIALIRQLI